MECLHLINSKCWVCHAPKWSSVQWPGKSTCIHGAVSLSRPVQGSPWQHGMIGTLNLNVSGDSLSKSIALRNKAGLDTLELDEEIIQIQKRSMYQDLKISE